MDNYSKEEIEAALNEFKKEYPTCYKYFFLEILEKNDSLRKQTPSEHRHPTAG